MAALAPSVSFPVAGPSPGILVVLCLLGLWLLAALIWAQAWSWRWAALPPTWWLMVLALGLTSLAWAVFWLRSPRSRSILSWEPTERLPTGRLGVWRMTTPAWPTGLQAPQVVMVLDLPGLVLLQFQAPQGLRVWCWLRRGAAPQDWLAIRRAVIHQPGLQTAPQRL